MDRLERWLRKDVPTVNLNNETASGRNLNFNAENIEGVDTWNVNWQCQPFQSGKSRYHRKPQQCQRR